jgi:dienelactone hydrolase
MKNTITLILIAFSLVGCTSYGPTGDQPRPGVIVLPTSGGVFHEPAYAAQLSRKGFQVVIADYHQRGGSVYITEAYDTLRKDPRVGKIGMVGFSRGAVMGISHANLLQSSMDRKIDAIVSFYIGPSTPYNDKSQPPILFLQGELDNYISPKQLIDYCKEMDPTGKRCKVKEFVGVGHAFDQTKTKPTYSGYNSNATDESYELTIKWLNQWLR